jgi:hypothetical protein
MKKLLLTFLLCLAAAPVCRADFSDMTGHWAAETVERMAARGVIRGASETKFDPDGGVTRAAFAALLVRALEIAEQPYENGFADVSANDWFCGAAAAMRKSGIIEGSEGFFRPNDGVTHEEAVKILVGAYETRCGAMDTGAASTLFDDYFEISLWARTYIDKGVMLGAAKGFAEPLRLEPQGKTTRAEAAYMLENVMGAIEITERTR